MADLETVSIAAGIFGSVTIGTLVFLLLQQVKAFAPNLKGPPAEIAVIVVSLVAVFITLVSIDSDWSNTETYITLLVGTLGTTVIARGIYAQLFKVGVDNVPPPPNASVPVSAVDNATQRTDEHQPVVRRPA